MGSTRRRVHARRNATTPTIEMLGEKPYLQYNFLVRFDAPERSRAACARLTLAALDTWPRARLQVRAANIGQSNDFPCF
jgi:hypothetical protein